MRGPVESAASSPSGLDLLLAALDPDRDRAADRLLLLRRKLVNFFAWGRAPFPDELADEALDRVARRLASGETIRNSDPGAYIYGFARNVLRESWALPRFQQAPGHPLSPAPTAQADDVAERRARCLDLCLARLPEESRRVLLAYYREDGGTSKIEARRMLAAQLNLSSGGLRLKVHRLRVQALEGCVRACLARAAVTESSPAHVLSKERSPR